MGFEWDEAKRQSNLVKHRIDFQRAQLLFAGRPTMTPPSPVTGEERSLTTGVLDGSFVTMIWTPRAGIIRIISVRSARNAEKRAYRSVHGG
ncbi:MAG: BrnT family toxin [Chloroflexota bacterium]|nr:BrnT family toxin [Chloroflexota bacterium]